MSVRRATDEMMRAAIADNWDQVTRIARQLERMANAHHRAYEAERWARVNASTAPPHVIEWIRDAAREREADERRLAAPRPRTRRIALGGAILEHRFGIRGL